jgi:HPt (histidine-containing phosphotransfer) domain-containing protein
VKSTEHSPPQIPPSLVPDDALEELRQRFNARLRSDQAALKTLVAALNCAADETKADFEGIEFFAHRLRGAAATFGAPELAGAAKALETAAAAATAAGARHTDAAVRSTLRTLTAQLAALNDREAPACGANTQGGA